MIEVDSSFITLFSPYGYIDVKKCEYLNQEPLVNFITSKQMAGSINKSGLRDQIEINLKTFHGTRKVYTLTMGIVDHISEIFNKLIKAEEEAISSTEGEYIKWNPNSQSRLICVNGRIRELSQLKTFISENISHMDTILLMPVLQDYFSPEMRNGDILLEDKNTVAIKVGDNTLPNFVCTNSGFNYGKHYMEFTLETEPLERSVMIGITNRFNEGVLKKSSNFLNDYYAFELSSCQKVWGTRENMESEEYGAPTKMGDKVGLMLEFTNNGCEFSFYINSICLGVAFTLAQATYYPCLTLTLPGAKVRVSTPEFFPTL